MRLTNQNAPKVLTVLLGVFAVLLCSFLFSEISKDSVYQQPISEKVVASTAAESKVAVEVEKEQKTDEEKLETPKNEEIPYTVQSEYEKNDLGLASFDRSKDPDGIMPGVFKNVPGNASEEDIQKIMEHNKKGFLEVVEEDMFLLNYYMTAFGFSNVPAEEELKADKELRKNWWNKMKQEVESAQFTPAVLNGTYWNDGISGSGKNIQLVSRKTTFQNNVPATAVVFSPVDYEASVRQEPQKVIIKNNCGNVQRIAKPTKVRGIKILPPTIEEKVIIIKEREVVERIVEKIVEKEKIIEKERVVERDRVVCPTTTTTCPPSTTTTTCPPSITTTTCPPTTTTTKPPCTTTTTCPPTTTTTCPKPTTTTTCPPTTTTTKPPCTTTTTCPPTTTTTCPPKKPKNSDPESTFHHPENLATQPVQDNKPEQVEPTDNYVSGSAEEQANSEQGSNTNDPNKDSGTGVAPPGKETDQDGNILIGGDEGVSDPEYNPFAGFEDKPAPPPPAP